MFAAGFFVCTVGVFATFEAEIDGARLFIWVGAALMGVKWTGSLVGKLEGMAKGDFDSLGSVEIGLLDGRPEGIGAAVGLS